MAGSVGKLEPNMLRSPRWKSRRARCSGVQGFASVCTRIRNRLSLRGDVGLRTKGERGRRRAGPLDLLGLLADNLALALAMAFAMTEMGALAGVVETRKTERWAEWLRRRRDIVGGAAGGEGRWEECANEATGPHIKHRAKFRRRRSATLLWRRASRPLNVSCRSSFRAAHPLGNDGRQASSLREPAS